MTDLPELLAQHSIRLKSYRAGHTEQVTCPKCEGGRTREKSLSVSIDQDGAGVVMQCHRGSCGWTHGARAGGDRDRTIPRDRPIQKPAPAAESVRNNRPDWLYEFFAKRQIGKRTVDSFGIYAVTRNFDALGGTRPTMVFPYVYRGELANRKYRPFPEKQPQQQDRDALQTLFNVDRLGDDPDEIVWVEGEPDVMALFECGIPHAVSLKDGAPAKLSDNPDDKRFEALRTHADILATARRIVLAGDMDPPGLVLREELARRLGRHRCLLVTWPEGCKDACDVLAQHGPDAVLAAIKDAQQYPIEGVHHITPQALIALRHRRPPRVMTTGAEATDAIGLRFPDEGRLITVTGMPGHGKTTWVRFVMIHICREYGRRWAVFSPEMQPWEQFAALCASTYSGKPFWPAQGYPSMTDEEIEQAGGWLNSRVTMLVCDAEDQAPTLDWILERARATILRDGVTDLLIDPWNEIEHARPQNLSETEYVGQSLQRLKSFGLRHGCNIWLVCHPAKPSPIRAGEKYPVPGAYSISGSAHFANKTDLGLTVYSPEKDVAEIHLWKARFIRLGRHPSKAILDYDPVPGTYTSPSNVIDMLDVPSKRWHETN